MREGIVLALITVGSAALTFSACEDETSSLSGSQQLTTVAANIETINNSFTPASLTAQSSTNGQVLAQENADPCEGIGFFECQPNLLKEYLKISKDVLAVAQQWIVGAKDNLGDFEDGSATITYTDNDQSIELSYTKSGDDLSLLLKVNEIAILYLAVAGNQYTIQYDASLEAAEGETVALEGVISFTDENNWTVNTMLINTVCNESDVRAPTRIRIIQSKASGVYTGKAQLYSPRWKFETGTGVDCNTATTDELAINLYTDYVANDTAAKGAIYFIPVTATTADISGTGIDAFGMPAACSLHQICWPAEQSLSNPFCIDSSGETASTTWTESGGTACTPDDSAIAEASFSAESNWSDPSTFKDETVTLPTSLSE